MRTDRDGAPLTSVDAEDAAQQAAEAEVRNGRTAAPYDVLQPREALLEAARLNRDAIGKVEAANGCESNVQYRDLLDQAAQLAAVAHSLAAYAEAGRWSP